MCSHLVNMEKLETLSHVAGGIRTTNTCKDVVRHGPSGVHLRRVTRLYGLNKGELSCSLGLSHWTTEIR